MNPGSDAQNELSRIYRNRFDDAELAFKQRMWAVLCRHFFQRFIDPDETVLDLGAGTCEFINNIQAGRKLAVDMNPDLARFAVGAEVICAPSTSIGQVPDGEVDVVFASNFFEHLPSKKAVMDTLRECKRVLRPHGKMIVLQPNIRYLAGRYWDYFDHETPLTHLSMAEALSLAGFEPERIVPRFLPYSVKQSRLPRRMFLLRAYLRLPLLWPVFGKQMLIVATPLRG